MQPPLSFVLGLLLVAGACAWSPSTLSAFNPSASRHVGVCSIRAQLSSPQIARPKVDIGRQLGVSQPSTKGGAPKTAVPKAVPKKKTQDDETPMYKVILLWDNEYDQAHVVTQITKVIPSVTKEEAIRVFVEASQLGTSIIITVTEEHAEHYVQQLKRQQIYAKMEKEGE